MTRRSMAIPMVLAALVGAVLLAAAAAQNVDPDATLAKADKLFEDKNYKEAAEAYAAVVSAEPKHAKWHHASNRIIICRLRLSLFDPALEAAEEYIQRCKGTPYEARAERLAGNLYMLVPHWGTRAGGVFHRAQWMQGIRLRCERYDKDKSVAHLQRARDLYAQYDGDANGLAALPADERDNW
ncbi:MAG TPA: hypothetical protein VFJ30_04305, partial [Phycisphaerae bacterium]|nr:hypothetical protein [Phycisphaerae bacterium]